MISVAKYTKAGRRPRQVAKVILELDLKTAEALTALLGYTGAFAGDPGNLYKLYDKLDDLLPDWEKSFTVENPEVEMPRIMPVKA
jgi:hypothetical protein